MKACCLFALLAACGQISFGNEDGILAAIKAVHAACAKAVPVTRDAIENLSRKVLPEDDSLKTYLVCFYGHLGLVDDNGGIDYAKMKAESTSFTGSHIYDNAIDDCVANPIANDPVTNVWNFVKCYRRKFHDDDKFFPLVQYFWQLYP